MTIRPVKLTLGTALVLRALLDGPRYGLELAAELELGTGTVFPVLGRLEAAGLAVSEFEQADPHVMERPARRYYLLTPAGLDYAVSVLTSLSGRLRPPAGRVTGAVAAAGPPVYQEGRG